jgi:prolyl 4-hydroxylase
MFRRQKKEILCSEPLVSVIKGFMSHSDCDELIKFVADDLRKSKETHFDGITTVTTARTGSEKVISDEKCGANKRQRRALSKLIDIKKCFFEHSVIINYKDGQQYKPHFDQGEGLEYKRLATAICYLNDVEEGGETVFPKLNITVKPQKGDLLYFKYNYPDNNINRLTYHGGRPVLPNHEKWIHTTWICEKRV